MIPRKLVLKNFMCYREDLPPLELDGIPIACLSGENGAGKSALLDAMTWVLWGQARLKSDDELIALGAQEMEVELIFALEGQDYRVIRRRSKGRRGQSSLDFQVRHNGSWKVLTAGGVRETQQTITSTLRMDYDIFANSAYLRQGHADEFTRKEPGRRKQVLADILGLDIYETLESAAKERAKGLDGNLKVLEGQISELQRQVEKRELFITLVAEAVARVEQVEQDLERAQQVLDAAAARVQALEGRKARRAQLDAQLGKLRAENDRLAQEVVKLRGELNKARQILGRRDEISAGLGSLRAAKAEQERLEGLRSAYDALQARRRTHEKALEAAQQELKSDLRLVMAELKGLHERAARRPKIEAELARLAGLLDGLVPITREVEGVRAQRDELRERSRTAHELELQRTKLEGQIKLKHDSLIGTREETKRRLRDIEIQLKDEAHWQEELERVGQERARLEVDLAQLEQLRAAEHAAVEHAGAKRSECEAIKARGEEINKKLALLDADAHICPLCKSELGHDGIAHIEAEYERERKELRAQFSAARREADTLDTQLKSRRAEIKGLESRVAGLPELAGRIARLERDLHAAVELHRRQAEDQRVLDDIQLQLVKGDYERGVRNELARVEASMAAIGNPAALNREMSRVEGRIATLEKQLGEQATLRAEIETQRRALHEIEGETPAIHEQELRAAELKTTLELGDYAREERALLARLDGEIAATGYTPDRHNAAVAEARRLAHWADEDQQLQRAQDREERDIRDLERFGQELARCAAEVESNEAELGAIDAELRVLTATIRERDTAQAERQKWQRERSVSERDLGEKRALLQRAEEAAAEKLECEARRTALLERKSLFDELTQAFGKKGVQALLIEAAIPELEREANLLLTRMTDNQMHLTFETQRDTKKGDVSETLEIKIADGLGTRDYDAFSGGEAFRLNFAIRVALAKLLAKRAGARLETLVIDEGFGTQDANGRERLIEAITSVQGEFKHILVITHIQELKEMFPVQIEITKTPRGSVWAVG